ncbi:MAG: ABC transporter ATP-binding protein, partial [Kiloniellaceae bacterium]
EFDKIRKNWADVVAVDDLTMAIEDGEFVSLLGPSGCGKSTTLFMLAGIYMPSAGTLRFDGQVVNEVEAKDRNVGIVFQSYALYPHMNVRDNILFPLRFKKVAEAEARERILSVARLVHIEELLERKPSQLSGGQQQRVALARALVKEPQLLLLDEPLSNLDATLRMAMRSEIKALQGKLGVTTILVTHDQLEATTMADRIVCMRDGRVEQVGTPDDLYLRPASLFVAGFIGAPPINLLPGKAVDGKLIVNDLSLPCEGSAAGEVTLGIRPENISFAATGIPGTVDQIEPMGRETLYLVSCPLGGVTVLEAGSAVQRRIGETVRLAFDARDTLVYDRQTDALLEGARAHAPG